MNRLTHYALIALLSATLYNCGVHDKIKPDDSKSKSSTSKTDKSANALAIKKNLAAQKAAELIEKAQRKTSPEKEDLLLQAAELYLNENETDKAYELIHNLHLNTMTASQRMDFTAITAEIYLKRGDLNSARALLNQDSLERELKMMEPAQEIRWRDARAQLFERSGMYEDSVKERISMAALITHPQSANENSEALWQTLMQLSVQKLQSLTQQGQNDIAQGWYQLALIGKNYRIDIESQQRLLSKWITQWRNHPAATNLPLDLQLTQQINKQQPKKIALLLPLSGRLASAGEAVRDGFFAAYYQNTNIDHAPKVTIYDSSFGSTDAYQKATAEGAELVIGPLDREEVNQLARSTSLVVPLLSLNYVDQNIAASTQNAGAATANNNLPGALPNAMTEKKSQPLLATQSQTITPTNSKIASTTSSKIPNLIQFGLATEDEARQTARQAFADGHKRAIIVSNGLDWSERAATAFQQEWQSLGGVILGAVPFNNQDKFAEHIRRIMLIADSQSRMQLLQQQLGSKFEFTPRRRADIDVIFLAVNPDDGRQIKPTLSFYFADKIPTYATSSIYSGVPDPIKNEDLNGVLFSTLPWLFDTENPEKKAILQTKSSSVFGRLNALGADAFHLYGRLGQLKESSDARIYGATGSMRLTEDGRIEREQSWAHFTKGMAEPIVSTLEPDLNTGDDQ